jgi:hypothetical protein
MCNRAARRSGETRAESPTKVPLSLARDASSGQATRSGTFPATSWRIRPCPCVRLDTRGTHTHTHTHTQGTREHSHRRIVRPSVLREHKPAVLVLPGAQTSRIRAPGSTIQPYLCSREHTPATLVPPGAQSSNVCTAMFVLKGEVCAPGSTNTAGLCSRSTDGRTILR